MQQRRIRRFLYFSMILTIRSGKLRLIIFVGIKGFQAYRYLFSSPHVLRITKVWDLFMKETHTFDVNFLDAVFNYFCNPTCIKMVSSVQKDVMTNSFVPKTLNNSKRKGCVNLVKKKSLKVHTL